MVAIIPLQDMAFSDYGLGGPLLGAEAVGVDLANPMLGGPEQGGAYTGGVGAGPSRTKATRQQAILNVNPYIAPSQGVNLDPITSQRSGGQTGYYFANELGLPARYGDAATPGFVPVDPNATYRLVSGGKGGDVVYSGAGAEGLRNVFQQANDLTLDDPKNAYWGVEVLDPATGQYKRVAENQGPNGLGIVGDIAGVALPIAAAIATGGASLGVQIAAGAAAGGLGGFLSGKDILKSALISGVTAGLGNVTGFNEAVGGVLSNAGDAVKNALIPELAKQAATEAGGDIVVNALSNLAKGTASGLLQGAASGVTSGGSPTSAQPTPTQQPVQEPVQRPLDNTIVVSATKAPPVVPNYGGALAGVVSPIATEFLPKSVLPEPLPSEPAPTDETIVVTAPQSIAAPPPIAGIETTIPAAIGGALTAAQTAGTPPSDNKFDFKDVLGTGLTLPQLISIGGIGADLLGNLLGGDGGAGTGLPYVSQFGPGVGIGAGRDMRANPNITDYERYGFGPEAMFFQPGYGLLNSAATPTQAPPIMAVPQAPPAMVTNPRYEPLI